MRRAAARTAALLTLALLALGGCAAKRFLGFGQDGTLIVRHHEHDPQRIYAHNELLGVADSGRVACFSNLSTGTVRVEARSTGDGSLTRAASIVLPPEQPRYWDIDHDQVLEGRAYVGLCS